jgi:FAD/FMN-containing dehydrogenase
MEEWVLDRLRQNFNGDITADAFATEAASTDASVFKLVPSAVAKPLDIEALKTLVRNVNQLVNEGRNIGLTPRGGGTCFTGGSLTEGVVVDMKHGFNWVGGVDTHDKSVWVGAGTYYRDLEPALAEHSLTFAAVPESKDMCVIGGMVGNNAAGEHSIRYGATADNVIAVRIVASDGNEYEFGSIDGPAFQDKIKLQNFEGYLYRELDKLIEQNWGMLQAARPKVRRNASGYNLWRVVNKDQDDFNIAKLIVGSQGTLGIVTAVKLRLIKDYKHKRLLVIPILHESRLAEAVKIIMQHSPDAVELYDAHVYELAKQYLKDDAEQVATVVSGKPYIIMAQFVEHTKDQTDHYAEVCQVALERKRFDVHYVKSETEAAAHWQIRMNSLKMLREHPHFEATAVACIEDTCIAIDHYGEFLQSLEAILEDYKATYTASGSIGDGNIHLVPLVNLELAETPDILQQMMKRVHQLVLAFEGTISAQHNDGILRTPYLLDMFGEDVMELFAQTKYLFDPLNIFNPGKKLGMTEAYAKARFLRANKA